VRVAFRATFRGLKTPGFKFPNPPPSIVEVFRAKGRWLAREATSKNVFKFGEAPTHGTMKDLVAEKFEKQEGKWEPYDVDGNPLDRASFTEDPAGNFTAVDLTHVSGIGQTQTEKSNYFKTFCGQVVFVKNLVSTRGQKPPTCKECKPEWEKVKPEDRLK
jgi:hypothetical protein